MWLMCLLVALDTHQRGLILSRLREKHPARCCGRRTLRASSGHLVLAKLLPGFWFHPHRTLLSRLLFSGCSAADVAAGDVRVARSP